MKFKSLRKGTNHLEIQVNNKDVTSLFRWKGKQVRKRQFKNLLESNIKNWKMNETKNINKLRMA